MATGFNILAWRIPWTEEPGGLQSMGLQSLSTEQLTVSLSLRKQISNDILDTILAFRRKGSQIFQKSFPLLRVHGSMNDLTFCMCSCHFLFFLKTIFKNLKIKSPSFLIKNVAR